VATLTSALNSSNVNVVTTGSGGDAGIITVSNNVSWTNTHTLTLSATNNIAINATISDSISSLFLTSSSGGTISEGAAGVIAVGSLSVSTTGSVTLTNSSNSVTTFGASSGALSFTDSAALTVGAVGTTTGIAATGNVTLTTNTITLSNNVTATGNTVTIQPLGTTTTTALGTGTGTLALTQAEISKITASALVFGGTGSTGAMSIGGAVTVPTTITNLSLLSGGAVNIGTGASLTNANSGGTVALQGSSIGLSGPISANGSVTLTTDSLTMAAAGTIGASGQTVTIQPLSATTTVGLGTGAGTLALTQTELGEITASTFDFGGSGSTGTFTVGGAVTVPSTITNLTLLSGGTISIGGTSSLTDTNSAGALSLQAASLSLAGPISSSHGPITLTTNSLALTAAISDSGQTLTIQPLGSTTTVGLGSGAGTLTLTQAELNEITAATFVYGGTGSSGTVTVGGPVTVPSTITNFTLASGGTISISSGASIIDSNSTGTVTLQGNTETIAGSITAPGLTINASGTITDTASVSVGTFDLAGGSWVQNMPQASMPAFTATNFQITGGSFLRVYGGDGSDSPYEIFDVYGLQGMEGFLGSNFQLQNNIDATVTKNWTDSTGTGFVPIGNALTTTYNATFNGQGFTISNLFINQPSSAGTSGTSVGLFGGIDREVENVNLASAKVTGYEDVGGLVGYNVGTVSNSSTSGTIAVSSGGSYVGGLVGDNYGSISGSSSSAGVTGNYVGGLVGVNDRDAYFEGSISNSYSTGSVTETGAGGAGAGGLAGENGGSITTSWSSATVVGISASGYVGGLVGENGNVLNYGGSISYSYALGSVSAYGDGGGLVGYNPGYPNSGSITQTYATGKVTGYGTGTYLGGLVGYNFGSFSQSYWDTQTTGQAMHPGAAARVAPLASRAALPVARITRTMNRPIPASRSGQNRALWVG
jgi:hypothetical protein